MLRTTPEVRPDFVGMVKLADKARLEDKSAFSIAVLKVRAFVVLLLVMNSSRVVD